MTRKRNKTNVLVLLFAACALGAACEEQEEATGSPAPSVAPAGLLRTKLPRAVSADGAGARSEEEVARVISRRMDGIKGCYERALRADPALRGKVTLRLVIAANGTVIEASAEESELPAEVGACLADKARRFRFSRATGEPITFEAPLLFTPAT